MYQFTYAGLFSLFFWLLVVSFQIESKKRIKKDLKELKKKPNKNNPINSASTTHYRDATEPGCLNVSVSPLNRSPDSSELWTGG